MFEGGKNLRWLKSLLLEAVWQKLCQWIRKLYQWIRQLLLSPPEFKKKWYSLPQFRRKLTANLIIGLTVFASLMIFHDLPWLMDTEDAYVDWMMEVRQGVIPSIKTEAKEIPPFVVLDIDDKTYYAWNEPLFTPRQRLKNLIAAAVKAKARLIVVDVDVSQPTPVEKSKLHPDDQRLKTYLTNYATKCRDEPDKSTCPPIILVRAFSAQPSAVPIPRTGFLEEVVSKSAPYVQWGSAHFYRSEDLVVRRWKLWQPACTIDNQPQVVPSVELLAMALVNECSAEDIQKALKPFLPQCRDNNDGSSPPLPETVKLCNLEISTKIRDINQRIMYTMPWLDDEAPPKLPYFTTTKSGESILTILPAQPYAESELKVSLDTLEDSIVLISGSYKDGRDIYLTPLGSMPGVVIIVNAIHSLLEYQKIEPTPLWGMLLITGLIVMMSIIFAYFSSLWGVVFSGIFIIFALLPLSMILFSYGIWLDFALPLIIVQIYHIIYKCKKSEQPKPNDLNLFKN